MGASSRYGERQEKVLPLIALIHGNEKFVIDGRDQYGLIIADTFLLVNCPKFPIFFCSILSRKK